MGYKILYLEDEDPSSLINDLHLQGFDVTHHNPRTLEQTIDSTQTAKPDLILLDFKLDDAKFNAPTIAQTLRTAHINTPIALISSEDRISAYYSDYTSQDLFDFAETKNAFSLHIKKYSARINNLIDGYKAISSAGSLLDLLDVPESLKNTLDPRLINLLESERNKQYAFIASTFIINEIIKPIGVLIGEDVLSARLGIAKTSSDWSALIQKLSEFKYSGIYNESYDRWWSSGLDIWWKSNFPENSQLRRLTADERKVLLQNKFDFKNLTALLPGEKSSGSQFWTICVEKHTSLDPIDGFQLEDSGVRAPWVEPEYASFSAITESDKLLKMLTVSARNRYKNIAQAPTT
jgi:CheY-like chemotaxis protein